MSAAAVDAKPLILFASIAAGGSHMSAARAIIEAVEQEHPSEYRFQILDIMKELGFHRFDRHHKQTWRGALTHPLSIYVVQFVIDNFPRITNLVLRAMLRPVARKAAVRFGRPDGPALIVATHSWTVVCMTLAQIRFGMRIPVVSFEVSTLNANALWAEPRVERYVTASQISKDRLERLGVSPAKVDVVGYPVQKAFIDAPSKPEARRLLGLCNRFTCLISLGGEGIGGGEQVALDALKELGDQVQIVVIAGKNRKLFDRIESMKSEYSMLHVRGFVDNMATYVAAADVVIGKTGPAVVYEILAVGRPILVTRRSGVVENKLLQVLRHLGIGFYTPSRERISQRVQELIAHPAHLAGLDPVFTAFDIPGMSIRMARYIEAYARTGRPLPSVCGAGLTFGGATISKRLSKV